MQELQSQKESDALQKIDVLNKTLEVLKAQFGGFLNEDLGSEVCNKISELIKLI